MKVYPLTCDHMYGSIQKKTRWVIFFLTEKCFIINFCNSYKHWFYFDVDRWLLVGGSFNLFYFYFFESINDSDHDVTLFESYFLLVFIFNVCRKIDAEYKLVSKKRTARQFFVFVVKEVHYISNRPNTFH